MNIRLISTLTPDDEARLAAAICAAAGPLLDHLSIAYTIRIETSDGQVFDHHHVATGVMSAPAAALAES